MKLGFRKPSLSKTISARTRGKATRAIKKSTVPFYNKGGAIKDPKRALYNKAYNKTTKDITGRD